MFLLNLFILSSFFGDSSTKLSHPRILLPFNSGVISQFIIEANSDGCFQWTSNRNDLVSVTPIPGIEHDCYKKAIISALSNDPTRNEAIILAEHKETKEKFRCDVVVDAITKIEIISRTKWMYLDAAPEILEVKAKNDQGDTFSSLSGIEFEWSIAADSSSWNLPILYFNTLVYDFSLRESSASDAHQVLKFLKFEGSAYQMPPYVDLWEKQNLKASVVLVQGIKTGGVIVSVKPLDPIYKHIDSYKVKMLIVNKLELKPDTIYMLPHTKFQYNLELIQQGKVYPVILPSDQYYMKVADKNIVSLDTNASTITSKKLGSTNVVVKDKYITDNQINYLPSVTIHVTTPSYLTLSVSPGDKWHLEKNKRYYIYVHMYDGNSHPLHITKDVRFHIQFPANYFKVLFSTINGTFYEIETISHGTCKIGGQLLGVADKDGSVKEIKPVLSGFQDVTILKSIIVSPAFTMLPWDAKALHFIYLKAYGGTGRFNWKSGDPTLASVSAVYENEEQKAVVTILGKGSLQVHATDAHMPLFTGFAEISVQPVADMQVLPFELEAEINNTLILPLAMYGFLQDKTAKIFSNCTFVPISVEIDEIATFAHVADKNVPVAPSACKNLYFKCLTKGFSRVTIKYESDDISLKKFTLIGCYEKLKVLQPSNVAVIALGSSLEIIFDGGPIAWPKCQSHYIRASPVHNFVDFAVMKNKSDPLVYKVHAFCKKEGEENFVLKVGNDKCDYSQPASDDATFKIACAVPKVLLLSPVLPVIDVEKCPSSKNDMIIIPSNKNVSIELVIKDATDRVFNNISSLNIVFNISDHLVADLSNGEEVKNKIIKLDSGQQKTMYFTTIIPKSEGELKVTAVILGYISSYLKNVDTIHEKFLPNITNSVKFYVVEEANLEPKKVSMFNSPSNKVFLTLTKGSGNFKVVTNDSQKAQVVYHSSTGKIEVMPLEVGRFTIVVKDYCYNTKHVADVHIYRISAIIVDVPDKLQLGHSLEARVEILNENKKRIPSSEFTFINLQPVAVSDVVSVKLSSRLESSQVHAAFIITGLTLGQTNIKFVTNGNQFEGVQFESNTYPIEVFSPLKISPEHIILIVGATFQVVYSGGPLAQDVEYLISNKSIADVSLNGIVEAKSIGKTDLYIRSFGLDKHGNKVVFSQDKAVVSCIYLKAIRIHSPVLRMIVGTEVPLYAMGITDEENPFSFGNALPTAKFIWSVSNSQIASLYNLYRPIGFEETYENNFQVSLRAIKEGFITVNLQVIGPTYHTNGIFSSDIQIQILDKLKLLNIKNQREILVSLNSELKLKCNKSPITYQMIPLQSALNATIDSDGCLKSSNTTGTAILYVSTLEFGVLHELTVIVKVKEISFLNIESVTKCCEPSPSFKVKFHDSNGLEFDAVKSNLQFRASRINHIKIILKGTEFKVEVFHPGYTVLKVWDENKKIPPVYINIVSFIFLKF